jgi:hemolysin D
MVAPKRPGWGTFIVNVRADPSKTSAARLLPDVEDRAFLPAALAIVETPASPATISLLFAICGFVVAALVWSWFGRLDIYATARGKIEPTGHSKVIQPLETGKVTGILLKEGQTVTSGQIVLILDPSEVQAQIAADTLGAAAAKAEALRRQAALAAVSSRQPPNIDWPSDIPSSIREREQAVLIGDLKELSATLENLAAQRNEKQATVKQLEASIAAENYLQETLDERVILRQTLVDKQVGTRTTLLDAIQSVRQAQAQLAGDIGKRDGAIAAVSSLDSEQNRTVETFLSDNTRKAAEALRLAEEKNADRDKARVRLDRLTLTAPVDGIVQSLAVTTIGQVVTAGQELMRIVPANAPIEIQAYISNDDIGFVSPGQSAFVKVDAFPFSRYGTIEANVIEVASDAIPDETANRSLSDPTQKGAGANRNASPSAKPMTDLVFEARLRPNVSSLAIRDREVPLLPGMTVTVEIKTGSRRVLEYLFSPLLEIGGKAMRER